MLNFKTFLTEDKSCPECGSRDTVWTTKSGEPLSHKNVHEPGGSYKKCLNCKKITPHKWLELKESSVEHEHGEPKQP